MGRIRRSAGKAFGIAVALGALVTQAHAAESSGNNKWRAAGGLSAVEATIPAGRVSDAVHASRIEAADVRPGVYFELARIFPLSNEATAEVEAGIAYNPARGRGTHRSWSTRTWTTSAKGSLITLSLFGNIAYAIGPLTVFGGVGAVYLTSSYDKHTVVGIELDTNDGGGANELGFGAQGGLRIPISGAWYTEYRFRHIGADKHDAGPQHLVLIGKSF